MITSVLKSIGIEISTLYTLVHEFKLAKIYMDLNTGSTKSDDRKKPAFDICECGSYTSISL